MHHWNSESAVDNSVHVVEESLISFQWDNTLSTPQSYFWSAHTCIWICSTCILMATTVWRAGRKIIDLFLSMQIFVHFRPFSFSRKLFLCLSKNYLLIFMRICLNFEETFCRVRSHDLKWQFMNRYITRLLFVHTVYKYKLLYTCTWTLIGKSLSIIANATFVSSSNISNLLLSWTSPHSADSASKNLKSVIRWSLPRRFKRQNFSMPSHKSCQRREQSTVNVHV